MPSSSQMVGLYLGVASVYSMAVSYTHLFSRASGSDEANDKMLLS